MTITSIQYVKKELVIKGIDIVNGETESELVVFYNGVEHQVPIINSNYELNFPIDYFFGNRDIFEIKRKFPSVDSLLGESQIEAIDHQFINTDLGCLHIWLTNNTINIQPYSKVIDHEKIQESQYEPKLKEYDEKNCAIVLEKNVSEKSLFLYKKILGTTFLLDYQEKYVGNKRVILIDRDLIDINVGQIYFVRNLAFYAEKLIIDEKKELLVYRDNIFETEDAEISGDELVFSLEIAEAFADIILYTESNWQVGQKRSDGKLVFKIAKLLLIQKAREQIQLIMSNGESCLLGSLIWKNEIANLPANLKLTESYSFVSKPVTFATSDFKKLKKAKNINCVVATLGSELQVNFSGEYDNVSLILKERRKNHYCEIEGKTKDKTTYCFSINELVDLELDVLSNKRWDAFLLVGCNGVKNIYRIKNENNTKQSKPDKYYLPTSKNCNKQSVYNKVFQLYWTKDNQLALVKNTESNLFKEKNQLTTTITSLEKTKTDQFIVKISLKSKYVRQLKVVEAYLVQRNKDAFQSVKVQLLNKTGVTNESLEVTCSVDFSKLDIFPLYWDIYLMMEDQQTKSLVRMNGSSKDVQRVVQKDVIQNQVRLENQFIAYPYVTISGDLSFQFRLIEYFETKENYLKENVAYYVAKFLAPYYAKRNIWIGFEKLAQSAHDSGYHFFNYCYNNQKQQEFYYVIDDKSNEKIFLDDKSDRVLKYMSFKYFVYLYSASLLVSSDTKRNVYNLKQKETKMGKALSDKKLVYLQHGVNGFKTVRDFYKDRGVFDLVIAPSDFERKLIIDEWGYNEKEVYSTGLARWDVMEDRTEQLSHRQIFLMPTWRTWMDGMSEEKFVTSDYYQAYHEFLASPELKEICLKNNLRIAFFLHPKFKSYIHLFDIDQEFVDKYEFLEVPLDDMIMKSSLMISDYSSIIWEMFYLKKPCVFYHFDSAQYLKYEGMYLDPETDLFGDRVFESTDLIKTINKYVTNDFQEEGSYGSLRNKYFTYQDKENSQRIYDVIKDNEIKLTKKINKKQSNRIKVVLGKLKRRVLKKIK